MVNIVQMDEKDLQTILPKVLNFMLKYYGTTDGVYYKYENEGNEYIFNRNGNRIIVMWEVDGEILYALFFIDEKYNVIQMEMSEFLVDVTGDILLFYEPNSPIQHSFYRIDNSASQVYNSLLVYSQLNTETDERLTLFYNYIFNENIVNMIYPHHIETPASIQYDKKASKLMEKGFRPFCSEKYLLFKSLPGDIDYEYFLADEDPEKNGQLLQRYMRWYGKGTKPIIFFPYCKYWKVEELLDRFRKMGFRTTVPQDIIESNNEGLVDLDEFMEIADCLRTIDLNSEEVEKKLVLRLGDMYDEDTENRR